MCKLNLIELNWIGLIKHQLCTLELHIYYSPRTTEIFFRTQTLVIWTFPPFHHLTPNTLMRMQRNVEWCGQENVACLNTITRLHSVQHSPRRGLRRIKSLWRPCYWGETNSGQVERQLRWVRQQPTVATWHCGAGVWQTMLALPANWVDSASQAP